MAVFHLPNFLPKKVNTRSRITCAYSKEENEVAGIFPEEMQASELLDKGFKITVKYAQAVKMNKKTKGS